MNCIKREREALTGDNTDGKGFLAALTNVADPHGASAVVIGAGGAARAVAAELALAGAGRITIVNRTRERAAEVAAAIAAGTEVPCDSEQLKDPWVVPPDADLVVQATTVGMGPEDIRLPLDWSRSRPDQIAADLVIAPQATTFLREATGHGLQILDGLGMLVEEAVIGFRWWTGIEPDKAAMRAAVERELGLA